jgi:hypothetical protein
MAFAIFAVKKGFSKLKIIKSYISLDASKIYALSLLKVNASNMVLHKTSDKTFKELFKANFFLKSTSTP